MFFIVKSKSLLSRKHYKRSLFDKLAQLETKNSRNISRDVPKISTLQGLKTQVFYGLDTDIYSKLKENWHKVDRISLTELPHGILSSNIQIGKSCTQNISCSKLAGKFNFAKSKSWPSSSQARNGFSNDESYSAASSEHNSGNNSQGSSSRYVSGLTLIAFTIALQLLKSVT